MIDASKPTASQFKRRVVALSYGFSLPAVAIILATLAALLEMTHEEWRYFGILAGVYVVLTAVPSSVLQNRIFAPITRWLDGEGEGAPIPAEVSRAAFARVMDLPLRFGVFSSTSWVLGASLIAVAMAVRFESFGGYEVGVLVLAGVVGCAFAGVILNPLVKRSAEPVRSLLAAEIPDPAERAGLVFRYPLRWKLMLGMVTATTTPVVFAVLLYQTEIERTLEGVSLDWQRGLADEVHSRYRAAEASDGESPDVDLDALIRQLAGEGGSLEGRIVDLDAGGGGTEPLSSELLAHVRYQVAEGLDRGDSAGLPSDRPFVWHRLGKPGSTRILLLSSPGSLSADLSRVWLVFGAMLLLCTGVSALLAYLLATDVSRSTANLRDEVDRIAAGDLRSRRVMESEDEIGDLARSFESMAESLRATVRGAAGAASRFGAAAAQMAMLSEGAAQTTVHQVEGIEQTIASMDEINRQVRGIADSSGALNVSVEESSSSILELGAAGDELNETASFLSERVGDVSTSIEQMLRSVRQVSENAESLSAASVDTSASIEQMSRSMIEVSEGAEEAARLSRDVVETAESGRDKVRQTIDGMDAIRESTAIAERVIGSLGGRTKEIGTIVGVIDDVADETNLLALNAAIIAAQAGEHGRAFTVVADEIKDLADRVLASTKEIDGLIRSVQEEAANAIGAVELGAERVAQGVDLSAEAGLALEEITRASRESGNRIDGIVSAVREQTRATSHVTELMETVGGGVDEIRSAVTEQDRANEAVSNSTLAMRDLAQQVRGTTEEQARGSGRIRESVEGVQGAVERINAALQEQSAACRSAVEFLEEMYSRTRSSDESARKMDEATQTLLRDAESLRDDLKRFVIEDAGDDVVSAGEGRV